MAELKYSSHVDVRPGWAYMKLAALDGETFEAVHLEGIRRFVAHVVGEHPCQLYVEGGWGGGGVGPPEAEAMADRLVDAFVAELDAVDEHPNAPPYPGWN